MKTFLDALASGPVVLDGAMGTELRALGCPDDALPAYWALEHPDVVEGLTRRYVDAGALVVLTNSFGIGIPAWPASASVEAVIARSVEVARLAADGRALVGGSISTVSADGVSRPTDATAYREQAAAFRKHAVDLLVIETMTSIDDLRRAVAAMDDVRGEIPVVGCMSFLPNLLARDGTHPEEMAWVLEDLGADTVGVNCCDGPETALRAVAALARATDLPIWAKPSAGIPGASVTDAEFADWAERLASAGARAIGGCCGTTPSTTAAVAARLAARVASREAAE